MFRRHKMKRCDVVVKDDEVFVQNISCGCGWCLYILLPSRMPLRKGLKLFEDHKKY